MTTTPWQSDTCFEIGLANRAEWRSSCRVTASLKSTDPWLSASAHRCQAWESSVRAPP